jgi:hypothetical protein
MKQRVIFSLFASVFCCCFFFSFSVPQAQPAAIAISGQVVDAESGEALVGAVVRVVGTRLGSVTGADGRFVVDGLTAGAYALNISLIGYGERVLPEQVFAANERGILGKSP